MKIEVYGEKTPEPEKVLRLKLKSVGDGVDLVAVDEDGDMEDAGYLLSIRPQGVRLYRHVSEKLGLKLEGEGYLALSKE